MCVRAYYTASIPAELITERRLCIGLIVMLRFMYYVALITSLVMLTSLPVYGQDEKSVITETDAATLFSDSESETETAESVAAVALSGVSEMQFNPRIGTLFFKVLGALLSEDATDAVVYINGTQVSSRHIAVASNVVALSYVFTDGLNELQLRAIDKDEKLLSADSLLWAGSHIFVVDVVDRFQNPVDGAVVTVALADDQSVKSIAETLNGSAVFRNVPPAMLAVTVRGPQDERGFDAVPGDSGSVLVQLR